MFGNTQNGTPVIEFSSSPTSEEFEKVAYSSKPIIVRGGAVATGMSTTFTFTTLKSLFESEPGAIESVINDCQFLPFRSSFTKLEEVFATVINDSQSFETPWYIGWYFLIFLHSLFFRLKQMMSYFTGATVILELLRRYGNYSHVRIFFPRTPSLLPLIGYSLVLLAMELRCM